VLFVLALVLVELATVTPLPVPPVEVPVDTGLVEPGLVLAFFVVAEPTAPLHPSSAPTITRPIG
jgi:hypothetical protein